MMRCSYIHTPIGSLLVARGDSGLTRLAFVEAGAAPEQGWLQDSSGFEDVARQLNEYFAGRRQAFDLPLAPEGTAFQREVWEAVRSIPYGERATYADLARKLGKPNAARAVGAANACNPIPIVIPCHRVVGSSGELTGYVGGLDIKRKLLRLEQTGLAENGEGSSPATA